MEYSLEYFESEIDVETYIQEYVDVETFLQLCQECPNYESVWSCPPYDFDPYDVWRDFDTLTVCGYRITYSDDRTEPEMNKALFEVKCKLTEELYELEKKYPGSMSLSAGSCHLCEGCTRPTGQPCRHPDKMRYSIESIGGNVGKTISELCGIEIEWIEEGKLPEHFVLVGGLLKKKENRFN